MNRRIFWPIFLFVLLTNDVQTTSITKRDHQAFQLIRETKERLKHGIQCLSPSKYFAGSCYTYMETSLASSWERAYNNCLSLPTTKDARLLAIESIDEYEFVERELIGLKSGSDSVSVYIGLRKMNNTWFWSNNVPLKETPVYRFWANNNLDILAYDCGILWFARNTSVITPGPCVEQALRPYICKQTIDRCYNTTGSCGKYGKCINLPLTNSYKCQCRFLYTGDQCEKWSSQGIQIIIGSIIVLVAFIISYMINMDRSDTSWSFQKSIHQQYQAVSMNTQSSIKRSSKEIDHLNPSALNDKHHWCLTNDHQHQQSPTFNLRHLFLKPKKLILFLLPVTLTILIGVMIINAKDYLKETLHQSTQLFQFCILYENNYYHNLLTLPIALVIILFIVFHQTRKEYYRVNQEKFSLYIPLPFNPFSKVNRFDSMILSGIVSYEILEIIEEIFLRTTQMKLLTINGPLFDLIRQIGLIIIVGLRYYPVYSVIEMSNTNILSYALCSLYMWLDLTLRVFEQAFCMNMNPLIRTWQRFEQFKNDWTEKYQSNWLSSSTTTTTMLMPEYDDSRSGGFKNRMQKIRDRLTFRGTKLTTTTIHSFAIHDASLISSHSLNWSSIDLNISTSLHSNDSLSTFEQFGIDSSTVSVLKYTPYYLCLTYICIRLTYLLITNIYRSFFCCNNETNSIKKPLKHIYHEPTFSSGDTQSIEYQYVQHLFRKPYPIKKHSFFGSLLNKIYQPNQYFYYSKQILNMYMIAFMLIYYLTFNILENGFNLIEKIYSFILMPFLILYDELDLPEPKLSNLKYEMLFACLFTCIIYVGQLFSGMKHYQRHMLNAYKGIFIDIPTRSAFKNARLMAKNIHYPGYCIAYLTFGYIVIGNILFFLFVSLRVLGKHLFLLEEIAKVLIPVLVIYLTKFIVQWFLSRTFFLQKHGTTMVLKNLRIYFVFAYFNFFFDCFLGIISCAFRVSKAWIATFIFLPRLDYCIHGRALEKLDIGFISYVSFIHMECLHTHPVLVYFCSIVNEHIDKRYQYLRTSKRDMDAYTNQRRILFRWWLAITLSRNRRLIHMRKQHTTSGQLSSVESFMNHFQNRPNLTKSQGRMDANVIIRNHTTTCTTLLLDVDEHDDRRPSF